jgi:hypothetical protein
MKSNIFFLCFLIIINFSSLSCSTVEISKADSFPVQKPALPKKPLTDIDLTTIKHIAPKGRAQDGTLEDEKFNTLPIAEDLLAHGKDSIPFLISELDDETKMKRQIIDFWYEVYVGDVALVILNDFFTKSDELTSTIPGFGWDEFLERGNDKNSIGEEILRRYIKKHGRKNIKERWQKMWDENKENIFWDESERCFNVKKSV